MFAAASPALRAAAAPPAGPAAALPSPRPYPSPHFVQLRQSGSGSIPGPEAINFQFCHSQLLWDEIYLAYVSDIYIFCPVSIIDISEELQDHLTFRHFWREIA